MLLFTFSNKLKGIFDVMRAWSSYENTQNCYYLVWNACVCMGKKKKKAVHLLSKEKPGIVTSLLRETGEFHLPHSFVSIFTLFSLIHLNTEQPCDQPGALPYSDHWPSDSTTRHLIDLMMAVVSCFNDGAGPARMRWQNLAALADRLGFCLCLADNQLLSDRAHQCWFTPDHLVREKKEAPLPFLATVFCSRHPSTCSLMSH